MPSLRFATLDVFTQTRYKGNPLAVVEIPSDASLSTDQMQTIAREFNLSETIFIHQAHETRLSSTRDQLVEWPVRIFMIDAELPFAGHPTIGAACFCLRKLHSDTETRFTGETRLQCPAGPISISLDDIGVATAKIPQNFHLHTTTPFTPEDVNELQPGFAKAGITPKAIDVVSPVKGMTFVCVELADLEALATVQTSGVAPRPSRDEGWEVGFTGSYFYVLTSLPFGNGEVRVGVRTRMIEGLLEDPATGSAACALGMLLSRKLEGRAQRTEFAITQAVEMGRQSDIGVAVTLSPDCKAIEKVELSGSAMEVMHGEIECP